MSIPKEPRQLMINIMYLVLTALLALNVSAEVFNAFKIVDKGLVNSNTALDDAIDKLPKLIREGAKTRPSFATYAERIDPIQSKSSELSQYLQDIVDRMIEDKDSNGKVRGGYLVDSKSGKLTDELKLARDNAVTTRTLINSEDPDKCLGNEIKSKLETYKSEILELIEEKDRPDFESKIAVKIDDNTWKEKDKASWAHMNFDRMPLQAVIPIFTKFINDVKSTEAAALSYLAKKVGGGGVTIIMDDYKVVSAPQKSYVIKGEEYVSEVFISAAAGDDSGTTISYFVDGRPLPANRDGKAEFRTKANRNGQNSYTVTAKVTDPVEGTTKTFTEEYSYEVGERSVAVSASKMNVFYIGVDNPVEVSAAGVPSNKVRLNIDGDGTIKSDNNGGYIVNVNTPTIRDEYVYVTVEADGLRDKKPFRVKRIPTPVPRLSNSGGGGMGSGEFKIQEGVLPVLENFEFDTRCEIVSFDLVRAAKKQDPVRESNVGGRYQPAVKALVKKAVPSDKYFYEKIKCKCPGDKTPRDLGTMVFTIR